MSHSSLHFFQGYTLVDITATGTIRGNDDELMRNQQRNWETVVQCMGLRAQPQHIQTPLSKEIDLELLEFGDFYTGIQQVWVWSWAVEQTGVYDINEHELTGLQADFEQVPIVVGLEETARFMLPIFYPYGTIKNIYFKSVQTN
jgi:hypothetical protein